MLTFTGMALDRAPELRTDPRWVSRCLDDPASCAVLSSSEGVVLDASGDRVLRIPAALIPPEQETLLLGLERGRAVFAIDLDRLSSAESEQLVGGGRVASLRDAGVVLDRPEGGLAAYLTAMLGWHRRHRFCSECGARTAVAQAGTLRVCERYGTEHFPRIDPAVIVLVHSERGVLLGRHADWPPLQYSVLAGFVAPGETLEEAIAREVREESAIEVHDPEFVTSQPWPFPSSLMLAFQARGDAGDASARDGELEDVRWFTREEVGQALTRASEQLHLPPPISVARYLLERWWQATA